MHGWGICERVEQFSRGVFSLNQGSLYLGIQRLEKRGWIAGEWRTTDNNRRARYYRLTASGRKAAGQETEAWRQYVTAVEWIIKAT